MWVANSGSVLALGKSTSGFWNECYNCSNFSSVGKYINNITSFKVNDLLGITLDSTIIEVVKVPVSGSYGAVYLGSNSVSLSVNNLLTQALNSDGVFLSK